MASQHPQFDGSLAGSTNPRRHRRRWLAGALALVALVVATVVVGSVVRSVFFPRAGAGNAATYDAGALEQAEQASRVSRAAGADVVADAAATDAVAAEDPAQDLSAPVEEPAGPARVRLLMIGDLLMHEGVIYSGDNGDGTFNYDHLFAHIADDVAAADVAVLNQETVLGGDAFPYEGYPLFNTPQELGDAEAAAGFDVILKATNHTLDMGYEGIRVELAYWRERHPEMAVIGMADPDGDGICPAGTTSAAGAYLYEKDGLTVALLNYTYFFNLNVDYDHDYQVVAPFDEALIRSDIAAAREQADIVVVFPHWGNEYETWPSVEQQYWADVFQDAGADVVIGGHPHVIQPVAVRGEGPTQMLLCWSVGNFVSTQGTAASMVGGMVTVDLVKDDAGARIESYEFMPVITQREPGTRNMTTYKLSDYTDELAAASDISAIDAGAGATKGWYVDYCAEVLGEAFDRDAQCVRATLG